MNHVELAELLGQVSEGDGPEGREVLVGRLAVPQGPIDDRDQARGSPRIARGEERDVVATADQLVGQGGYYSLGAAVTCRGHRLKWWSDLRDSHRIVSFSRGSPGLEVALTTGPPYRRLVIDFPKSRLYAKLNDQTGSLPRVFTVARSRSLADYASGRIVDE